MTIEDMHQRIEQETFNIDGLMPERIDQILNDQILAFVRSKLPKKRNIFREGMDDDIITAMDLAPLKRSLYITEFKSDEREAVISLPSSPKCLYPYTFSADLNYCLTGRKCLSTDPVTYSPGRIFDEEYAFEMTSDPNQKSNYLSPGAIVSNGELIVLLDKSFILKGVRIYYIKYPNTVSLSLQSQCDLPEYLHPTIVSKAIAEILENSESKRLQTKIAMQQTKE